MVQIAIVLAAPLFAGCTSIGAQSRGDTSCADINREIGDKSRKITATAISRGKVDNYEPPFWLLGASRAKSALAERDTRKIDKLVSEERALIADRRQRCGQASHS